MLGGADVRRPLHICNDSIVGTSLRRVHGDSVRRRDAKAGAPYTERLSFRVNPQIVVLRS